jgi:hypothetical protein
MTERESVVILSNRTLVSALHFAENIYLIFTPLFLCSRYFVAIVHS